MTDPLPLTPGERPRVWRWQRRMFVFYGIAIALLALAGALMLMFGDLAWLRRAAVALLFVLLAAATLVQFGERCPRCGLRLGAQGRLFLPRAMPGLRGRLRTPAELPSCNRPSKGARPACAPQAAGPAWR